MPCSALAIALVSLALPLAPLEAQQRSQAPPNEPAQVQLDEARGTLALQYAGATLLEAKLRLRGPSGERDLASSGLRVVNRREDAGAGPALLFQASDQRGAREALEQRVELSLIATPSEELLLLTGTVQGSPQAFAAETRGPALERFPLIRNSVGPSVSLRNNAVYDRRADWVLFGAPDTTHVAAAERTSRGRAFTLRASGTSLTLTFKPRFYQKHKNLTYFEPWTYDVWGESVAGWCSWWPYRNDINEAIVAEVASVFATKLRDFGYRYIQIDDGYQAGSGGLPEDWLKTNERFPTGLAGLASTISSLGLEPAIWVNVHFGNQEFVREHLPWFIRDAGGSPHKGPWIDYGIDGTVKEAIDTLVRPVYRTLRGGGWRYVKVDALRHLLYDSIYPCRSHFQAKGTSGEEAYRNVLRAIREELGRDTYMLSCWGVLPESIGIADGCRLGGDGFGPTTLVQYNSWNNVVWRNDPDHVDITPEGEEIIRPVTVCMAGAMMMLTDRVEIYRDEAKIEGARRCAPIPFTLPGQLYDFDPVKTDNVVAGRRNEAGGGPAGPIDADQHGTWCPWWLLEISRPFESWHVLARLSWEALPEARVAFADLGLPADRDYLIYEFWSKRFLGSFRDAFPVPAQTPKEARVYVIRAKLDHPQIVSTNRHIAQGWPDLDKVTWDAARKRLSGESTVVKNDPYTLVVRVPQAPQSFRLHRAVIDRQAVAATSDGELCTLTVTPFRSGTIAWSLSFETR
ncbi:MAG: hypothetical protein AB1486_02025 [Planctomycetota bacterium]